MVTTYTQDVILLCAFLLGVLLFVLKRASFAARSETNGCESIGHYFRLNWAVLLYRVACEVVLLWWPFTRISLRDLGAWGVAVPDWLPAISVNIPTVFGLGLIADFAVDWLGKWDKTPALLKRFITEQLPPLPVNGGNGTQTNSGGQP